MLNFYGVLLTAVIAALVSLTVAVLNNHFTRQSQEDEYKRRRRDWFLEKQARDAEEIVMTLDRFLKDLSTDMDAVDSLNFIAVESVIPFDLASESPEDIKRYGTEALEVNRQVWKTQEAHMSWFNYDALRLSVWFDPSAHVDIHLSNLGVAYVNFFDCAAIATTTMTAYAGTIELPERQKIALELREELKNVQAMWDEVIKETILVQRSLIDHLRNG